MVVAKVVGIFMCPETMVEVRGYLLNQFCSNVSSILRQLSYGCHHDCHKGEANLPPSVIGDIPSFINCPVLCSEHI